MDNIGPESLRRVKLLEIVPDLIKVECTSFSIHTRVCRAVHLEVLCEAGHVSRMEEGNVTKSGIVIAPRISL